MTISVLRNHFRKELSELYTESESDFIFSIFAEKVLNFSLVEQRINADKEIESADLKIFQNQLLELLEGKPYQQIIGETEFYGALFKVNKHTLIPRPETEELLEIAINDIKNSTLATKEFKVLEIGSGSGIIPITLKRFFPSAVITSIDFSEDALLVAKQNAEIHKTEIRFVLEDYLQLELQENYDVIISNPPYIGKEEEIEIENSVKDFEPTMALFSPTEDALIFYRKIAKDALKHLNKEGFIFLEINQKLGKQTTELYSEFPQVQLIKDLSNNDRFVRVKN